MVRVSDVSLGATHQLADQVIMYEQSTETLAEATCLENHKGLSYTDLVHGISVQFRNNEDRINGFKEEVKRLSGLTKESLPSLTNLVEVQKANEQRIADLVKEITEMATLQVKKDAEASQQVAELQAAQETSGNALREQERKNEELVALLWIVQREGKVHEELTTSQATIVVLHV
ncbi:hypothetical protein R1flu_017465 [Riccia fluitans]|uniref:Uncharacterized protein n=1 Tax=Riccia fluitans TaxID=41844 RepID=A0ABD1ZD10_9MARC